MNNQHVNAYRNKLSIDQEKGLIKLGEKSIGAYHSQIGINPHTKEPITIHSMTATISGRDLTINAGSRRTLLNKLACRLVNSVDRNQGFSRTGTI